MLHISFLMSLEKIKEEKDMEGYQKVQMSDHQGNIIFPETVAEMVRETPNRRFISYVEAKVLGDFAGNPEVSKMLVEGSTSIRALVDNEPRLSQLLDQVPSNFEDIAYTVEELGFLLKYKEDLLELIGAPISVGSINSGKNYLLSVDDTDPDNPILVLNQDSSAGEAGQPTSYVEGSTWTVGEKAPDVLLNIPLEKVVFDVGSDTILMASEAFVKDGVKEEVVMSLVNGEQDINLTSENGKIPQAVMFYNIKDYLTSLFPGNSLEKTVTSFTNRLMGKSIDKQAFAQTYMSDNVVQPTRTVPIIDDYVDITFQNITWTVNMTEEFINNWLNGNGLAAVVIYGQADGTISLTRPSLNIYIKNPYIGKTLVAKKDMGANFDILDWTVVEEG